MIARRIAYWRYHTLPDSTPVSTRKAGTVRATHCIHRADVTPATVTTSYTSTAVTSQLSPPACVSVKVSTAGTPKGHEFCSTTSNPPAAGTVVVVTTQSTPSRLRAVREKGTVEAEPVVVEVVKRKAPGAGSGREKLRRGSSHSSLTGQVPLLACTQPESCVPPT